MVWFGESLLAAAWQRAATRIGEADLLLIVGTSGLVPGGQLAGDRCRPQAPSWEINLDPGLKVDRRRTVWTSTDAVALPAALRSCTNALR